LTSSMHAGSPSSSLAHPRMRKLAEWFGAAAMVAAPFNIDAASGKILAIVGLALLTVQALQLRAYNLVLLNTLGILGYCYAIYF